ncbi:probably inactive leucine-rich repeat receptor-like protein kinase At5g06940 [Dioscorea cayenensis subsp. rotundata]|uniref:Probably inactive leucine-rich repeat receptor-like protein kinase At5g06940 n=1 Tax=Dioscorea cayennensis subsp. rotundata TaxID=55577 RepID=A0AB40AQ96_DIOCR|nr:probably inactive leucine-rich repeat receptor-like protein kinase At5g06940 [Dioscorea cayenensis subsp. rotundata]
MATPHALLLLFIFIIFISTSSPSSDQDLLLTFKTSINGSLQSLSNWSPTTPTCNFTGISCSTSSPPSITSLDLQNLNLSGSISFSSLCQLHHLSQLNLAHNLFNQPIPLSISQCTSLTSLNFSNNLLWGTLPDQFTQLTFLTVLDLSHNQLEGQIPLVLGSLQSLQVLNLGSNLFSGSVHPSIFANLTHLMHLDLSKNPSLSSELPVELGKLSKIKRIFMQGCGFFAGIPESILVLHELEVLDLSRNNLTGRIPLGFGLGLPKLLSLDLSQNRMYGSFPADVCYGKSLQELSLHANSFTGFVPDSIGKCSSLERIQIQDNEFYGQFPSGLWSLPEIRIVRAENNRFSGELPDFVKVPSLLEQIQIDNNSFTGRIPKGIGQINTLYRFSASFNGFHGDIPDNLCDSPVLSIIDLSHNSLSGSIPDLRKCKKLVSLYLADNSFTGSIPLSLAYLPVLTYIDLSSNNLSGEIPQELQNLKLALFNVSFNQLSGRVPFSLVSGLPASFLQGNPGLCGPGLPNQCGNTTSAKSSPGSRLIFAAIAISFVFGFMVLALGLFVVYRLSCKKSQTGNWRSIFFYSLGIREDELLMSLDEKNIIGRGIFGDVYKIKLPTGECIAVKKLLNSSKLPFRTAKTEIRKLAKTRQQNLAKLLGFCHSESVVLLIHEYLSNGSLGDSLCSLESPLDWRVRLQIALSAARGVAYLHKDHSPRLLHRNIKSNNILLDMDFEPKITGFALDHVIGESSFQSILASELDSCCYIAPEQKCSKKATEQMDVYSFGVVLLELITGKKAEIPDSRDSIDIVTWVRRKINMTNAEHQILDSNISNSFQQEMLSVLELALCCISVVPDKRPSMFEVVQSLQSVYTGFQSPKFNSGESSFSIEH